MSEYRKDPFSQRWRIFAEGRSARPNDYASPGTAPSGAEECPFCEGREARTPPEVAAIRPPERPPNGPGWSARSVPNRFPTLEPSTAAGDSVGPPGFARAPAAGSHEVIVTSPTHAPSLAFLPEEHLRVVFRFFRERVRFVSTRPGIESTLLFENKGPESGGTLPHPHAQLVAGERVFERLREESEAFDRHARSTGAPCLLEDIVRSEEDARDRIVLRDELFDVFAPFASEHPYELWVAPRRHAPTFGDASDAEVDRLSELLPAVLRALDTLRPGASYNWFVHGARGISSGAAGFHWHVEVAPRLVRADGFEIGSGTPVNPLLPEHAADEYRKAWAAASRTPPRKA
jgi:UDPglucose--hexose-1-phosphate uridylyltransferase